MAIRYPIANQVLGAAGITGPMVRPERLKLVLVVLGGGPVTVSWADGQGRVSTWPGAVNEPVVVEDDWAPPTTITGTGATVIGAWVTPGTDLDPKALALASSLATTAIDLSVSIPTTTTTPVYTCPAGKKARVLGWTFKDGGSGSTINVLVGHVVAGNPTDVTEAMASGVVVGAGTVVRYGPSNANKGAIAADQIVRNAEEVMLPGQILLVNGSGAMASSFNVAILEEPL